MYRYPMGRPRSFDEQHLLDVAEDLFWSRGYERTSIELIAERSGVANGSLYSAYGSKLGLFLKTFERYCDQRVELVENVIADHAGSFEEAVVNYLDKIVRDCTSGAERRGCLMLNSIGELAARFPDVVVVASRTIERMENVVAARVAESVATGEIDLPEDRINPLGAHVVMVSQGLIQLSRVGVSAARLQTLVETSGRLSALLRVA
jgi:AcrR family transcriptional regulator